MPFFVAASSLNNEAVQEPDKNVTSVWMTECHHFTAAMQPAVLRISCQKKALESA